MTWLPVRPNQALNLAKEAGFELESINTQYCGESHEAGEPTGQTALFGYDGEASNEWLWSVQYDAVISSNKIQGGILHGSTYTGRMRLFSVLHKHLLICFNARMANRLRNLLCMTGRTLGKSREPSSGSFLFATWFTHIQSRIPDFHYQ